MGKVCYAARRVLFASLLLLGSGALHAEQAPGAGAKPPTTFDQFTKDFEQLKKDLAGLQKKIEDTTQLVKANTTPGAAKEQIDSLRQVVAGLLAAVADDGGVAKLGQAALNYVHGKLSEVQQDTHFPKYQKDKLVTEWQRISRETETAVADLETGRRELSDLLRVLQTNEDFIVQMEELRQAQATAAAIADLANQLHVISEQLKDLVQKHMIAPSM
jgi:uncharacterized phage infection (PIP) family protein YhgE